MRLMNRMEAKIQKWGNSEGIRIPHNIIKELHLKTNDIVNIPLHFFFTKSFKLLALFMI